MQRRKIIQKYNPINSLKDSYNERINCNIFILKIFILPPNFFITSFNF